MPIMIHSLSLVRSCLLSVVVVVVVVVVPVVCVKTLSLLNDY